MIDTSLVGGVFFVYETCIVKNTHFFGLTVLLSGRDSVLLEVD